LEAKLQLCPTKSALIQLKMGFKWSSRRSALLLTPTEQSKTLVFKYFIMP